jgi:uncharacterized cupin superfamily protein
LFNEHEVAYLRLGHGADPGFLKCDENRSRHMSEDNRCLIRAKEIAELPEFPFRHPLNPKSEIHLRSLSALAGLRRIGLHIGRVPPGAESFVHHYHHFEEEFVYILSGRGLADIGEQTHEVGPGDVMLFTAPSVAHHLRNPFDTELVYLMGGENREVEIGEFPRLGKRAIFEKSSAPYIVDVASTTIFQGRSG